MSSTTSTVITTTTRERYLEWEAVLMGALECMTDAEIRKFYWVSVGKPHVALLPLGFGLKLPSGRVVL